MKYLLSRIGFGPKMNKKKKKSLWTALSNSTMYLAFVASLVLHSIAIYSIPAINIFSEGPDTSSDVIVVDFFQEERSDSLAEMSQLDSDQFQAEIPAPEEIPIVPSPDIIESASEPEEIDIMPPPSAEILPPLEQDTFLLAQADAQKPEIAALRKRTPLQLPTHSQPPISKQQPSEKPRLNPPSQAFSIRRPRNLDEHESVKIRTFSRKHLPQQNMSDDGLQFPLRSPEQEQETAKTVPEIPGKPFPVGKRSARDLAKDSSALDAARKDMPAAFAQIRQFGISKEKENDTTQFGIFAGRKFEEPTTKEVVEETVGRAEQLPPVTEETEQAQVLQTENQIEGPIKGRAIIRRPQPPQINIDIEVELRLKFWVLPDGTIGEVIPIKRGDAELERIAMTYLKQWRFEPLDPGVPQEKIWGTIPIRFTVQ